MIEETIDPELEQAQGEMKTRWKAFAKEQPAAFSKQRARDSIVLAAMSEARQNGADVLAAMQAARKRTFAATESNAA